jgi:hypothetical protein
MPEGKKEIKSRKSISERKMNKGQIPISLVP